jgi:type IV pilus assembly protein PilB
MRLGELLSSFGLLTAPEVESALRRQRNEGGRLGTCLLDSGVASEPTLLAALGAQQRVETVDGGSLLLVPREAARLLPVRAALHASAVPLARSGRVLEVAMLDPQSLVLRDELESALRVQIVPRLALEVRLFEAMERLYGIAGSDRLARTRARIVKRLAIQEAGVPARPG